jgi:glycosyltransferase involved in cell wall biosynthesis
MLQAIHMRPAFLMVSTIEPRKGYEQTLDAFTQLWQEDNNVNLVIVGKEGWKDLPDDMRHTIPEVVQRLRHHSELGKRLFWLEGVSDAYLEKVYESATCLIAASEGEGFGLPLIEAAHHKLPIIARDIPIFREVAGEYAYYFSGKKAGDIAETIKAWLNIYKAGVHPRSDEMPWLTWKQSTEQLITIICPNANL